MTEMGVAAFARNLRSLHPEGVIRPFDDILHAWHGQLGYEPALVRAPVAISRAGTLRDDIARITQSLAHEFEIVIRAAPEQWHLLQPNWPSDRE